MTSSLGKLKVSLGLNNEALKRGLKDSQIRLRSFAKKVSLATAGVGAVAGAGLAVLARRSFETVDAQSKLAQSLGTSTRSVQVLTRAADLAGIPIGQLEQASGDLTKRLSEAATGGGPAADALERLGLEAESLISLPLDDRIDAVNRAIEEFIPPAERAAVRAKFFGDRAFAAVARLDTNVLAQAAKDVDDFGVAVSEVDADNIEAANDAMSRLRLVFVGLGNSIASALAPLLLQAADFVQKLTEKFRALSPAAQKMVVVGASLAAATLPLAAAFGLLLVSLAPLAGLLGALLSPFAALAVVGVAVAAAVYSKWDELRNRFPKMTAAIEVALGGVGAAFGRLSDLGKENSDLVLSSFEQMFLGLESLMRGDFQGAVGSVGQVFVNIKEIALNTLDVMTLGFSEKIHKLGADFAAWMSAALGGGIGALVDFKNKFLAEISGFVGDVLASAKNIGANLVLGIKEGLGGKVGELKGAVSGMANDVLRWFKDPVEVRSPSRKFQEIGGFLVEGLISGVGAGQEGLRSAMTALADIATIDVGGSARGLDVLHGSMARLQRGARDTIDGVRGVTSGVVDTLKGSVGGAIEGLISGTHTLRGALSQVTADLGRMFLNKFTQSLLGKIFPGGGGGGGGKIPGFAKGTNFAPGGLAVVGEMGPELVDLPRGSRVTPNDKLGGSVSIYNILDPSLVGMFLKDPGSREDIVNVLREEGFVQNA